MREWPRTPEALEAEQIDLAARSPALWGPGREPVRAGGVFVCFERGGTGAGACGDPGWAAAVVLQQKRLLSKSVVTGVAGAPYQPGYLALREGPLMLAAVRALEVLPDVLLVNASGRDHPRRAGLALHLGAILDRPTVGVTWRPLCASGPWPDDAAWSWTDLTIGTEVVAAWVRVRPGVHPIVVHPGWRTDLETAMQVIRLAAGRAVTPEPIRQARRLARTARNARCSE